MKKTTKFENFKWALFIQKIYFLNWWYNTKYRFLKFKYCRRGFHCFKPDKITFTSKGPGKKELKRETNFIKCIVCGGKYFPTEKDKRNWEFIEEMKDKSMRSFIEDVHKKNQKKNENRKKTIVEK